MIHLHRVMHKASAAFLIVVLSSAIAFSQTLTFAVVGDTGQANKAVKAIGEQMSSYHTNKSRMEFVLLLGDNIYPNGIGAGFTVHFERPFQGLIKGGVKFYAALGNHDIQTREGAKMQTNYAPFNMGGRHFYSFKTPDGLAEFFALDSTSLSEEAEELADLKLKKLMDERDTAEKTLSTLGPRAPKTVTQTKRALAAVNSKIAESEQFLKEIRKVKSEQLPWLDQALANSTARWKIVFLHHALYSSAYLNGGHGNESKVLRLRKLLNEKFVQHKVDVVFGGHDHVFEKTKVQVSPLTNHRITYITSGAGSKLRKDDLDRKNSFFEFGEDLKYSFLVVHLETNKMDVDVIDSIGKEIFPRFSIAK